MTAELQLTRLRHDFQYGWLADRAVAATPPSESDVAKLREHASERSCHVALEHGFHPHRRGRELEAAVGLLDL